MNSITRTALRQSTRTSDLATILVFSLAGLVMSLALVHFGLDFASAM